MKLIISGVDGHFGGYVATHIEKLVKKEGKKAGSKK
jgi:hypothetical protein